MMDAAPSTADLRAIMVRLQKEYLGQIRAHLDDFRHMRDLLQQEALPEQDFQRLYRLSHDFAGSGATFGFPDISRTARALHLALKSAQNGAFSHFCVFEEALCAALAQDPAAAAQSLVLPEAPEPAPDSGTSDVYFIGEADDGKAAALAAQVRHFGYNVITGATPEALEAALRAGRPKAVVAFRALSGRDADLIRAACAGEKGGGAVPFIIVAPKDDFKSRLAAVRLGAQGFFTGEADALKLIERIEQLSAKFAAPPRYHVMIVDDDRMLTEFYNHTLTRAGMSVTTLTDPAAAVDALNGQRIDLLLIDFSMPGCNGQELAAVIRQFERHVSLPIVFISSYDDLRQALIDTGLGIDDFLVKPFTPEALYTVVRSRAQRAAELNAFMTRDGFTGLLNHAYFNETLANELARVRRGQYEASYAMIDLDHFKSVNDTYGHAAGDQVIRALARMLQQHLRRSDIIGRCGGEEFGIILPDCPLEKAMGILEKLRVSFAETVHAFGPHKVQVTFSAGLVKVDPANDIDLLMKTADAALYTAKKQGRNRIRTFEG